MTKFIVATRRFVKDEAGATMVEYGLMLALIAIVAMVGASVVGINANSLFGTVSTSL